MYLLSWRKLGGTMNEVEGKTYDGGTYMEGTCKVACDEGCMTNE